jgi:hypothetical protein
MLPEELAELLQLVGFLIGFREWNISVVVQYHNQPYLTGKVEDPVEGLVPAIMRVVEI